MDGTKTRAKRQLRAKVAIRWQAIPGGRFFLEVAGVNLDVCFSPVVEVAHPGNELAAFALADRELPYRFRGAFDDARNVRAAVLEAIKPRALLDKKADRAIAVTLDRLAEQAQAEAR